MTEQAAPRTAPGPAPRAAGRPRDAAIEQTVLRAAVELIRENSPGDDFTIGELVERSGVSRAAIYRRWENRKAIIVAALDSDRRPVENLEDATVFEALTAGYTSALDSLSEQNFALINQRLMLGLKDPALQREYWERHVTRRREALITVIKRGQQMGEVRAEVDPDVVLDLLNGTIYYQGVVRGDWNSPASRKRLAAAMELVYRAISEKQVPR